MKKRRKKLSLNRETLRNLSPENLSGAAGGYNSTSDQCTLQCTGEYCTGGGSACICPLCPDITNGCDTTGPISAGCQTLHDPGCPSVTACE